MNPQEKSSAVLVGLPFGRIFPTIYDDTKFEHSLFSYRLRAVTPPERVIEPDEFSGLLSVWGRKSELENRRITLIM